MEMSGWFEKNTPELKEQLRRWANTQRLEGNYVAAQTTERALTELQRSKTSNFPVPTPF